MKSFRVSKLSDDDDDNGMIAVSWGNESDNIHNMPCLIIISVWHIGKSGALLNRTFVSDQYSFQ